MVTDGLQLYYDVNNIKSYPGEPTTNLTVNPDFEDGAISGNAQSTFYNWTFGSWSTDNSHDTISTTINGATVTALRVVRGATASSDFFDPGWAAATTVGLTYTWSAWIRGTPGSSFLMYSHWGGLKTVVLTSEWQRYDVAFVRGGTSGQYMYFKASSLSSGDYVDVANVQLELKGHVTPFTTGTRSTTDGLKDLSGNSNHNNLNNVSFDSNARPTFTVSTDSILIDELALGDATNWTVCMWIKATQDGYLLSNASSGPVVNAMGILSNKIMYRHYSGTWLYDYGTSTVNDGTWHFVSWVNHSDETMDMYVDAIVEKEGFSSTMAGSTGPCDILGNYWSSNKPIGGPIDVVMIYPATALTSSQILQNYNALKGGYI